MTLYPIFLDLSHAACLVIGGGPVAERKIKSLLAAGARITLVSPESTSALQGLADTGRIEWRQREARESDLDTTPPAPGFTLVFLCTNSPGVQRILADACRARGLPFNAADSPEPGAFQVPAVLRRGELAVAVSTGGACPPLARHVRDAMAQALGPSYEILARILGEVRRADIETALPSEIRRRRLDMLLDGRLLDAIRRDGEAGARAFADRLLGSP